MMERPFSVNELAVLEGRENATWRSVDDGATWQRPSSPTATYVLRLPQSLPLPTIHYNALPLPLSLPTATSIS